MEPPATVEKGALNERSEAAAPETSHLESGIIDPILEKRTIRKVDWHIVPAIMLLDLFSFLDRVNIGNARLYGLEEDLGLVGNQFQTAVSILFVTYALSEVPSNLVIKKFTPSRWISFISTGWGIVATLTGIVQNYQGLIACRVILGALEGGLFPGLAVYLALFYTKHELALRIAYLFMSSALAGSTGGLLAYAIGHMEGIAGLRGWRWIMIIEGIPTVLLGIAVWFWLADNPETAGYLTEDEKRLIKDRMRIQPGYSESSTKMHKRDVIEGFTDWKVLVFAAAQFGVNTVLYGYSTFLPTIIKDLGEWSNTQVQALTIPCYAAGALSYLVAAWLSDRTQRRAIFVVILGIVTASGYGMLISPAPSGVKFFGCVVVAVGLYAIAGIPMAWLPCNIPQYGKRAVAMALQVTVGNCAGVSAPFLYPTKDSPRFIRGHSVSLGLVMFSMILYSSLGLYFRNENRKRDKAQAMEGSRGIEHTPEMEELADKHPSYRYTY